MKIVQAKCQKTGYDVLAFYIPGQIIRCKIAALFLLMDQRKPGQWRLTDPVDILPRPIRDVAVAIIGRDNLPRITAERVSVQWNRIEKDSNTATHDRRAIFCGRPRQAQPGRNPCSMRQ